MCLTRREATPTSTWEELGADRGLLQAMQGDGGGCCALKNPKLPELKIVRPFKSQVRMGGGSQGK